MRIEFNDYCYGTPHKRECPIYGFYRSFVLDRVRRTSVKKQIVTCT
jgi:hypothetical protein